MHPRRHGGFRSTIYAHSTPPAVEQERICAARRRTGWSPRLIAGETGHAHATVWRALQRAGISRTPRQPREQPRRYEWPCPGDLLHIDSKRFVRFTRPGHVVTGDRYRTSSEKRIPGTIGLAGLAGASFLAGIGRREPQPVPSAV